MAQEMLKVLTSWKLKNKMKFSPDLTKWTLSSNVSVQLLDIYQFLPLCRWVGKGHSHFLTYCTASPWFCDTLLYELEMYL